MVRKIASRFVAAAALSGLLAACSSEAPADGAVATAEPPVIEERQDNFEAIGDAFKLIRGEMEKPAPDLAVVAAQAGDINTRAMRIEGYFPAGTGRDAGHDTEALPAIWEKPEEFAAAHRKLVEESAKLVSLAEAGDAAAIGPQVMAMGGACKGCHDQFRLAKQ